MKTDRIAFMFFLLVVLSTVSAWSQVTPPGRRVPEFTSRQEYVSFDSTLPFDKAISALSEVSKRFSGKIIIDLHERTAVVGVTIRGLHWRDALDLIADAAGVRVVEKADYIEVKSARAAAAGKDEKPAVTVDTREVLITSIFFSLNLDKSLNYGIDWSFSFLKLPSGDTIATTLNPVFGAGSPGQLDATYGRAYPSPYGRGTISAALQLFSQNGLGEIISSPRIIVRSAEQGRVQVGQDISIVERTITPAGTTESVRQLATGTILTVTPEIIKEGDVDFVSLELELDRSNAITTGAAPTIDRSNTKTKLLLVDGEEAFISGLYFNQEDVVRTGIPLLKDLPWWFFGLRYIFGSEERLTIRRELAVLIRAEILPTLKERAARRVRENVLEIQRKVFEDDLERLRSKKEEEMNK